jgi:protein tyrosine/serine phosphatase
MSRRFLQYAALSVALGAMLASCAQVPHNPDWAVPIANDEIDNLHRVSKDLYRGAQPSDEGFRQLKAMGIKAVVCLRREHSSREIVESLGMNYYDLPTKAWNDQQFEPAVAFLKIVSNPRQLPVFVYCNFGGDRTGMMVAVYRLAVCNWTRQDTLEEMRDDQFDFHEIWDDLVHFIEQVNVEDLKARADLKVRADPP